MWGSDSNNNNDNQESNGYKPSPLSLSLTRSITMIIDKYDFTLLLNGLVDNATDSIITPYDIYI